MAKNLGGQGAAAKGRLQVFILAGGSGTRFWPESRTARPKQFLPLGITSESLIQATARRMEPLVASEDLFVVTSKLLASQVHDHVPNCQVIAEPIGRNTAASIGLAAISALKRNPDPVIVILPADHAVANEERLRGVLSRAAELAARSDFLVTIGIKPGYAHTGYGYLQRGSEISGCQRAFQVKRFFEKPNADRAQEYCDAGDFYWNSGMFVWRATLILEAIRQCLPALHRGLMEISGALGTAQESKTLERVFPQLESISIDFGVLERVQNCALVEAEDFGWNDVGSWDAWAEQFSPDAAGNLLSGAAVAVDSSGCIVRGDSASKRTIALLGVENLVVIDSGDALLVCPRSRVQDVKRVVDALKAAGKSELV